MECSFVRGCKQIGFAGVCRGCFLAGATLEKVELVPSPTLVGGVLVAEFGLVTCTLYSLITDRHILALSLSIAHLTLNFVSQIRQFPDLLTILSDGVSRTENQNFIGTCDNSCLVSPAPNSTHLTIHIEANPKETSLKNQIPRK